MYSPKEHMVRNGIIKKQSYEFPIWRKPQRLNGKANCEHADED